MYADIHSAASATIAHSPASRTDRSATGIWPELLSDLCCLGEVWLETESPAMTPVCAVSMAHPLPHAEAPVGNTFAAMI